MPWLKRCGAFLMVFMICRTPDDPCRRSKLDELIVDDDCCGCDGGCVSGIIILPLLLSKMVGIAVAAWIKALLLPLVALLLENRFNSLAVDGVPLFDERRFRNDNDFKRLNFVDSRSPDAEDGDDCFCRSSNDDTNWSKTFKSAFILEFRMTAAVDAPLSPLPLPFDESPKRFVI